MGLVAGVVAAAMGLAWVPAAVQFTGYWRTQRDVLHLGVLGIVLWFVYHNTLAAVDALSLHRADGRGLLERIAELAVLLNLYLALGRRPRSGPVKVTNGVNPH